MARTTGTASVTDLIEAGLLEAGEQLVLRQRNKPDTVAQLTEAGALRIGNTTYATPSAAAKGVTGAKAAQGWTRWHVVRTDTTLGELRNRLS